MNAVDIQIDDKAALAKFERLIAAAADVTKPMQAAARGIEQLIRQTFRDERDPWGNPWPALSPLTLKQRRREGNASIQKLLDKGVMYGSLVSDANSQGGYIRMSGEDRFPGLHQDGNYHIPARPMFPIRDGKADVPANWWAAIQAPFVDALDKAAA